MSYFIFIKWNRLACPGSPEIESKLPGILRVCSHQNSWFSGTVPNKVELWVPLLCHAKWQTMWLVSHPPVLRSRLTCTVLIGTTRKSCMLPGLLELVSQPGILMFSSLSTTILVQRALSIEQITRCSVRFTSWIYFLWRNPIRNREVFCLSD